jgi:hypothetical protein
MHNVHPFTLRFQNRLVKLQCVFTRAAYFDRLTVQEKRDAIELRPYYVLPNDSKSGNRYALTLFL